MSSHFPVFNSRKMKNLLLLLLLHLLATSDAATFACTSPPKSTCQSLIGYKPPNATTLLHIKSLFQVKSLRALLAANNLPLSTPSSHPIPPTSTVRIRFTCRCLNGSGSAARGPVYKVQPGDGLDSIARNVFNGFVTYHEIASASNISDPNLIEAGQRVVIPLPCSCDDVDGGEVVHYAHVVEKGSSVEGIGSEFGVSGEVLMRVNRLKDPKKLLAGQVLDVPLRACSSSISSTSLDHDVMRVPNGSYIFTANNCVQCSCSSPSWQLDCSPAQGLNSTCPAATCGSLKLGNSSSSSPCERSVCAYAGYTNNNTILTNLTIESLCNNGRAPLPQPAGGSATRLGVAGLVWVELLMALMLACAL